MTALSRLRIPSTSPTATLLQLTSPTQVLGVPPKVTQRDVSLNTALSFFLTIAGQSVRSRSIRPGQDTETPVVLVFS